MAAPYDEPLGPRLDVSQVPDEPAYGGARRFAPPVRPSGRGGGAPGTVLSIIAMVLALLSLGMALWTVTAMPERRVPSPLPSSDVVAGGTGERVAKLEKDVSNLMLRLVTLEKELEAVRGRAGPVTKLTEVVAKVAALQERLDAITPSHKPAPKTEAPAAAPPAPKPAPRAEARPEVARPEAQPPAQPAARPAHKPAPETGVRAQVRTIAEEASEGGSPKKNKITYVVKRGDTLFTVAQRFKVSMKDIQRWNDLKPSHPLQLDQRLEIYQ